MGLALTAAAAASGEDIDGGLTASFAPVPLMQLQSPMLIKARSDMSALGASSQAATLSAPLISQPLMLMSGTPQVDPQTVAEILSKPSSTSASSTTFSAVATQTATLSNLIIQSATAAATSAVPTGPSVSADDAKVALYTQLMELNGTTINVHMILRNAKDSIRLVVIERAGTVSLTPEQELHYDDVASAILKQTEADLIRDIASTQSKAFTETEIKALIKANASPAAQKYNAAKYAAPSEAVTKIQAYMVDAVYKILKTYTQGISS